MLYIKEANEPTIMKNGLSKEKPEKSVDKLPRIIQRYIIPKFSGTTEYFGDPWGRGGMLPEKGFKRIYKSTFLETWEKELLNGTKIIITHDPRNAAKVLPADQSHEAYKTVTHFSVEFEFPDTSDTEKNDVLLQVFKEELDDLFYLGK